MSFGILVSGQLGYNCLEFLLGKIKINFVFTDKGSVNVIEFCAAHSIPCFAGNPRNGRAAEFLQEHKTDIIFSINYLFIVDDAILNHPKLYAINLHGSLLPKYRGRTPHIWAIINNEDKTGITAHLMDGNCDTGDIVYSEEIAIKPHHTGGDLLNEFYTKYPAILEKLIERINSNDLLGRAVKQKEESATYYGKRTPEDGAIVWDWQKERIYNWVRALSRPYPGAFCYYRDQKIIIHRVSFSDHGYTDIIPNGTVLKAGGNIIIKTQNGAITIDEYEAPGGIVFREGERFTSDLQTHKIIA